MIADDLWRKKLTTFFLLPSPSYNTLAEVNFFSSCDLLGTGIDVLRIKNDSIHRMRKLLRADSVFTNRDVKDEKIYKYFFSSDQLTRYYQTWWWYTRCCINRNKKLFYFIRRRKIYNFSPLTSRFGSVSEKREKMSVLSVIRQTDATFSPRVPRITLIYRIAVHKRSGT